VRAITHIGAATGASDDDAGTIVEAAREAWTVYLRACAAAPPDPVGFAGWFVDFQLDGPDWPDVMLDDVVDLLGDAGLAAYRRKLDEVNRTHAGHWRVRAMREELIEATGDTDDMVACLAEDLSGPHQYVRIADLLRAEDRPAEAVEWLERGLAAGWPHNDQVVEMLADLYATTGRAVDVVRLRQRHFDAIGSRQAFDALRAVTLDSPQWPDGRALDRLRERVSGHAWHTADTFAAVLLDEGEVDEAWQVTQTHLCREEVRLAVTARRGETEPADAIAVYRPLIEAAIAETSNPGYARAAQLLLTMRPLYARVGDDFARYIVTLKEANRRKRNFLAELARNGL
jgi:hypothetical protein